MKLWKVGKVKKVFQVSQQELEFGFTDQISVFGKVIPSLTSREVDIRYSTKVYWLKETVTRGISSESIKS